MDRASIGIIGGTGLGEVLCEAAQGREVDVSTPYGSPSSRPILAEWEGAGVAFISRHGPGHCFNPSTVPYRANIWAMKQLGVQAILASGATGSLQQKIKPADLVVCDQVIDKTFRRAGTFFDEAVVAHVELSEPFCPFLRAQLIASAKELAVDLHAKGTYVCMEGPQFSSRAESHMHRLWGGDLIGMTCMPEAKLAREAEICYAMLALPTDYDCWRATEPGRSPTELMKEILSNVERATKNAIELIRRTVRSLGHPLPPCQCREALRLAIWSDKSRIPDSVRKRLEPLIGRYLSD